MTENTEFQILALEQTNPLREPALRAAIAALKLAPGTHGLDIGCGIGLQSLLLAEATHPGSRITGLDISPELLRYAQERVKVSPLAKQISFKEGDMAHLPFEDNTFDWAWSADCVGYPAADHLPLLREITRMVRPGGRVALLAWTSQQMLPGHALLEAKLNAECSPYAPFLQGREPEAHFLRLGSWFPQAEIAQLTCHTLVGEVQAPITPEIRVALTSLFEMLWCEPLDKTSQRIWLEYKRLSDPQSPDFILNIPDYNAFFTYTMFSGIVKKS
jgi:demethylmenaquinone methyltransferase/2-methoxy-6-polyprenyl-1,4-benzoquinol methylase